MIDFTDLLKSELIKACGCTEPFLLLLLQSKRGFKKYYQLKLKLNVPEISLKM